MSASDEVAAIYRQCEAIARIRAEIEADAAAHWKDYECAQKTAREGEAMQEK